MKLLRFTDRGIYCPRADVYIDPWKKVNRAIITHGHSDHARAGNKYYACTNDSVAVLKYRLGKVINVKGYEYGKIIDINGVKISFHPAGHIIGSAQIRLEHKGEIWVVSGDYKTQDDHFSGAFEPLRCQHFITETTFGLPVYKWEDQKTVINQINEWWSLNKSKGIVSILTAYALGKAQRIIQNIDHNIGKIYTHGAIENTNEVLRSSGIRVRKTIRITNEQNPKDYIGQLVICPSSAIGTPWMKRFKHYSLAAASGWMALRGMRRRRGFDFGFVLSDHCDWNGLTKTIKETGAEHIYPTHGYTSIFSKWLTENGYKARVVETEYENESFRGEDKLDTT